MRGRLRTASRLAFLSVLAVAACERRDAATPDHGGRVAPAFTHRTTADLSGDYRALSPSGGTWRVDRLFVGQTSAFDAWEGGARGAPPLILTLSGPGGVVQATPRAYAVTDERLTMEAIAPGGQAVTLTAQIDQGGLATARRNLGDETAVIIGSATIDGARAPVRLSWWGGD